MSSPSSRFARPAHVGVLFVMMLAACFGPKRVRLEASPDIPAAESSVKLGSTDNGNTKLELEVHHLAAPDRVRPGATVYVVWVRANEGGARPQNLGGLKVDGDLNGQFSTVTPLRNFELFITAEPSQSATDPTGRRLLFANISK